MDMMSKHHYDGTKYDLDQIRAKVENEEYGPEVIDTISFLLDSIDTYKDTVRSLITYTGKGNTND